MIKINILNNKKCQIFCDDEVIFKKLYNHLSFKLTGVEYSAAYQNGWSGITYLMTKGGKFSYGLLFKVKTFLDKNGYQYQIEDLRQPKSINKSLDLSKNLEKLGLTPREHQIEILNAAVNNDIGIIRAATGAGKTQAIAMVVAKINKPAIVYTIGLDLLDQFYKLFSDIFDEPIGYVGNGICNIQRINIVSIWTAGRALKLDNKNILDDEDLSEKELSESNYTKIVNLLKETKVHIFDESHVVSTNTIADIYKNIDPEHIYGFSGTPFRNLPEDLLINSILGEQLIDISASRLIKANLLAQPLIRFYTVPKMSGGSNYLSVYKDYIVENDKRNNLIVDLAKELIDKKYTPLVLFKQIKHGNILFEKLKDKGIRCGMLYGNDSLERRTEIKEQLKNKEIDLIIASVIFDIGLNLVELNALVLAGGGKSSIRALQRVGRVLRMTPGKKYAAVVDFYDQAKYLKKHSQIRYNIYSSEEGFKVFKSKEMK